MENGVSRIKTKLLNAFNSGKLPSSIIFYGPGSQHEKDDFIYDIAYSIMKIKRNIGKDKFISLIASSSFTDFVTISKGSTGSIKVDEVKQINEVVSYKPFESGNRIFYFKDAEAMTHQAQNAILKIIEEPDPFNYFFLMTNKKNSLLRTITSRCVSFYIPEIICDKDTPNEKLKPENYFPFLNECNELFDRQFILSEMKTIEMEAKDFSPERLTSIDRIEKKINIVDSSDLSEQADKEYSKRLIIKMRLAFFSYFLKNIYPALSEKIALFLNNRQFITTESSVFYNFTGEEIGKQ